MKSKIYFSVILSCSVASVLCAAQPTTGPSTMSIERATANHRAKLAEIYKRLDENDAAILSITPAQVLRDEGQRSEIASAVLKLVQERMAILTELTRYTPRGIDRRELSRIETLNYLFKDPATVARVDAMLGTTDAPTAHGIRLRAAWHAASGDPTMQLAVAAEAEALAVKDPANAALTDQIVRLIGSSANLEVRNALIKTCTVTMQNASSKQIIDELERMKSHQSMQEAAEKQTQLVGKPMVVSGPNIAGGTFSTADLKGKVVLIDFWATWCAPCKAELPHVKALYKQYHDQGFEIVGISADQSDVPLKRYVAENDLGWIHLFDAEAASKNEPSAMMKQFNIAALPTMFLIDRQGICRSVTARHELDTLIPKLLAEPAAASPSGATGSLSPTHTSDAEASLAPTISPAEMQQKAISNVAAFQKVFNVDLLTDRIGREGSRSQVVPAARQALSDCIVLGKMNPDAMSAYRGGIVFYSTILAIYGDKDGQAWLDMMAQDEDPRVSLLGQTQQLYVRWCRSSDNAEVQAKVVTDIETLAGANPKSLVLAHQITKMMNQGAADPSHAARLQKLLPAPAATPAPAPATQP